MFLFVVALLIVVGVIVTVGGTFVGSTTSGSPPGAVVEIISPGARTFSLVPRAGSLGHLRRAVPVFAHALLASAGYRYIIS